MWYTIFYYVIICYMFSEVTTTVLESFANSIGKHPIIHVNYIKSNFLNMMKLYKDICSA